MCCLTSLKVPVSGSIHSLVGCHGQPDHLVGLAHRQAAHPDEVEEAHDQDEQDLQQDGHLHTIIIINFTRSGN